MVAEVRAVLVRLEEAVAYEGTDYGEMVGDLRETAERIDEQLTAAIAYVHPLVEPPPVYINGVRQKTAAKGAR
jgi:hypothetical protein